MPSVPSKRSDRLTPTGGYERLLRSLGITAGRTTWFMGDVCQDLGLTQLTSPRLCGPADSEADEAAMEELEAVTGADVDQGERCVQHVLHYAGNPVEVDHELRLACVAQTWVLKHTGGTGDRDPLDQL